MRFQIIINTESLLINFSPPSFFCYEHDAKDQVITNADDLGFILKRHEHNI